MANIKVRDLADTSSITSNNQIMVLTDDANNVVKNITIDNFNANIISTDANNGITQGADGNLYVDDSNSGVTAGNYQYPQNLTVDAKGKITSIESGNSAPTATSSSLGLVQPDNSTINVDGDGVISVDTIEGSSWAFPSTYYDELTLGASGATYTAPANGYFYLCKVAGAADKYIQLVNNATGITEGDRAGNNTTQWLFMVLAARKGEGVQVNYTATGTTQVFRFFYAKGSESEYTP